MSPVAHRSEADLVSSLLSVSVKDMENTYGAILLGTFVGLALYGLTLHQTYEYFHTYDKDPWHTKIIVWALMVLNTMHTIENLHTCYHYLISEFFSPFSLYTAIWSVQSLSPTWGMMVLLAQAFYARRLYRLNPCYRVLVGVVVLLMLGALGCTLATAVEGFLQVTYAKWEPRVSSIDAAALAIGVTIDVMLATMLVILLRRERTGFKSTDSTLDVIAKYTINTCVLTSAANGVCLFFALAFQDNLIWIAIGIPAAKLNVNAVLAVLNCRKSLTEESREVTLPSRAFSSLRFSRPSASTGSA